MSHAYIFYPGCSMETTARSYLASTRLVCQMLDICLEEVADWNCCGATEYLGLSRIPAYALIARNLALAEKQAGRTRELLATCSACYLNLEKVDHHLRGCAELEAKVNAALAAGGLHYTPGALRVRHLLDVLTYDIGLEAIKGKVIKPLYGLRPAAYVGCMLPRPDYERRYSNPDYPDELDRLLRALGADVVDFPLKTTCCGGHMAQIAPATALAMLQYVIHSAAELGADLLVTVCPMCQMNLDMYQGEMNAHFHTNYRMPVVFFTQLIALAFGAAPAAAGFGKELVDARPALQKIAAAPVPRPAPPRTSKSALPMPHLAAEV